MKHVGGVGIRLNTPVPGQGKNCHEGGSHWELETYSDADWSSNRLHRRSIGVHLLNGAFMYGSSRGQKTISFSSCESELR